MYDKHRNQKIGFQAIVDNSLCVEFNTAQKRNAFVELVSKMPHRRVTCTGNVCYPWNSEDGLHNLKSLEDFAKLLGYSVDRVERAVKNGFLQTERLGDRSYIVDNHDHYRVKGILHIIREND